MIFQTIETLLWGFLSILAHFSAPAGAGALRLAGLLARPLADRSDRPAALPRRPPALLHHPRLRLWRAERAAKLVVLENKNY